MILHNLVVYAFVLLILLCVLALASLVTGKQDGSEYARKAVHIIMGLVSLSFPWLFKDSMAVFGLALISLLALLLVRRSPLSSVLFSVKRSTVGDLLFPISVALTFALSQSRQQYFLAVAILTFADTCAAIFGKKYGHHFYGKTGSKSLEGSLAFLAVAAVISLSINLAAGHSLGTALANTLALSLSSTVAEALSNNGTDNLSVPICALMVMKCCA